MKGVEGVVMEVLDKQGEGL